MSDLGTITFAADDGSEFSLPVNEDGTCGPLPKAGVMKRWNPPVFRDSASAQQFAEKLSGMGYDVSTYRSSHE